MSTDHAKKALQNFAVNKLGSAIVLKGDWGTGKTYLWNSVIHKHSSQFARPSYSYVSLFGINSLADLKRSIFENTVQSVKANNVASKSSVIENLRKLDFSDTGKVTKKLLSFGKEAKIPYIGSFGGMIDSIQYSFITDTLVCIDDFERRGNSLSTRDVLGLISNLVESKDCSVLLLLNEGELKEDDEFYSFSEKVFDYDILYSPLPKDSIDLIFDRADFSSKLIGDNCEYLQIKNIRLLKKIKLFHDSLYLILKGRQSEVIEQACRILPLAVLAIYGGKSFEISIEDIMSHGHISRLRLPNPEQSSEEKEAMITEARKHTFLQEYGFAKFTEFDLAVLNLVKKGYSDEILISRIADQIEREVQHNNDIAALRTAWLTYKSSFLDNETEVLIAFDKAIDVGLDKFSLEDLDSIANLYYGLGKESEISGAVDKFFEDYFPNLGFASKEELFQQPSNAYVMKSLNKYFEKVKMSGSFYELMQLAYNSSGDRIEIVRALAEKEELEFYDFFSYLNDVNFIRYAELLLKLGKTAFAHMENRHFYESVFIKTFSSLKRLSEKSSLNKMRMSRFLSYEPAYLRALQKIQKESHEVASPPSD